MKLAILIGASGATKESAHIPLGAGRHKLIVSGMHDSDFLVMLDNGSSLRLNDPIPGDQVIHLVRHKKGTEASTICIYAERIEDGDELNESAN